MRDDPRKATVSHFHGPLTVGLRTVNWEARVEDPVNVLRTGGRPTELYAVVGTMSREHGCWVVVGSYHQRDRSPLPEGIHPVAEVEFSPAGGKGPPVRARYELDRFC
jgi:hypothetical protein